MGSDDATAPDDRPGDRLRTRVGGNRTKLWVLLEADRRLVVAAFVGVVFPTLLLVGVGVPGAARALRAGDSVDTLFQGLLTATITGVTLILTLNQLVLSQELGAVGDQRERMAEALAFRNDAADAVGAPVAPARPSAFLRALVEVADERAAALRDVAGDADGELHRLAEDVRANAGRVATDLDGAQFGEFDVLSAALLKMEDSGRITP